MAYFWLYDGAERVFDLFRFNRFRKHNFLELLECQKLVIWGIFTKKDTVFYN